MSRPAPSLTVGNGALGLLATAIPGRADAALSVDIAGAYRLARSGMVMLIGDCGDGRLCARVAALGKLAATDAFNPIPANRSRPVCGLVVMTGLTGDNEGWLASFYDPQVGGDYTLNATRQPNGSLCVSAHTGPPFLMRTYSRLELWEPVAPPQAACGAPTPTS
jgi:Uncharacterized protein conserved in bacteria (DUF2147)